MGLFKLSPIDLMDPNWQASSHRAAAIVRARDESAARTIAAEAFDVRTGFQPGRGMRVPPWLRKELVRAERIEDSRWESSGPEEVLYPSFGADLAASPKPSGRPKRGS